MIKQHTLYTAACDGPDCEEEITGIEDFVALYGSPEEAYKNVAERDDLTGDTWWTDGKTILCWHHRLDENDDTPELPVPVLDGQLDMGEVSS